MKKLILVKKVPVPFFLSIAHDDNEVWYKGWSMAIFRTIGTGGSTTEAAGSVQEGHTYNSVTNLLYKF